MSLDSARTASQSRFILSRGRLFLPWTLTIIFSVMAPSSTRELIHLSYGSLPAHISTHYFDAQQAYFDYSPSAPRPLIDHDVSWLQGVEFGSGRDRYTPRWIVYDTRDGFQGLNRSDDAGDDEGEGNEGGAWSSQAEVMRVGQEDARTPFRTLTSREARGDNFDWDAEMERHFADDEDEEEDEEAGTSSIRGGQDDAAHQKAAAPLASRQCRRPWSHYLLFEPHPRSLIPILASGNLPLDPMPSHEGDDGDDDQKGTELFETFESGHARSQGWEAEHDTFDTTFRSSLEACDRPQGFNVVISASDAWAGFTGAQLELMADEYPKLAKLGWAVRSGNADWENGSKDEEVDLKTLRRRRTRAMNEALSLLTLSESLDLYVPLAPPEGSNSDRSTASVLSSHFETATLGARLRDAPTSLSNLVDQLTWRGGTPLASLGGEVASASSPSAAPSSSSIDPIDALLAFRGYGPASANAGRRRHPEQEAINARRTALREGSDGIDAAWHCFSDARADSAATKSSSSSTSPWTSAKPFALSAVSRLGKTAASSSSKAYGQPPSRTDIVQHWLHPDEEQRGEAVAPSAGPQLQEPWGRLLTTPLTQPSHAATPSRLRQQPAAPLSALYCSSQPTLRHLSQARRTLLGAVRGHAPLGTWGVGEGATEGRVGGRDGLKELLERVEELRGGYEDGGEGGDEDEENGGKGTDEEWEDQQGGDDDDDLDWS